MDSRVGQCTVVVWTRVSLYKQLVEYCCGSLSSSLVNTQLVFPLDISTERFTYSNAIGLCVQWLPQQSDNIEINGILYNIQWEGKYPIIINNDRSKMDTLSSIDKLAEPAITSYLAYLAREERVEQICFLLAQCATESCTISKSLKDVTRLLANI